MNELEKVLTEYFGQKAPQMPMGLKTFLVSIAPYLAILGVAMAVLAIFPLISLSSYGYGIMSNYGMMQGSYFGSMMIISLVAMIAMAGLEVMAIPGLFAKTLTGWRYMFYAQLVSLVSSLLMMNIIGFIIGAVIGFYILFQVKSLYK